MSDFLNLFGDQQEMCGASDDAAFYNSSGDTFYLSYKTTIFSKKIGAARQARLRHRRQARRAASRRRGRKLA